MLHFERQEWPQGSVAQHGAFALRVVYILQNKEINLGNINFLLSLLSLLFLSHTTFAFLSMATRER